MTSEPKERWLQEHSGDCTWGLKIKMSARPCSDIQSILYQERNASHCNEDGLEREICPEEHPTVLLKKK